MPRGDHVEQRLASVLASRVDRILLVLECITDNRNYLGILRTCDVLGVQRVCVIHPPAGGHAQPTPAATSAAADGDEQCVPQLEQGRKKNRIARASSSWLDIQHFSSSTAAIAALKQQGWTIWATDLSEGALALDSLQAVQLPPRLAIVMGTESSGISSEMRQAADRCVYLPMFGFTDSLNVGVATALVLQALIAADPSVRGQLLGGEGRAGELTTKWRAAVAPKNGTSNNSNTQQKRQHPEVEAHEEGQQPQGQQPQQPPSPPPSLQGQQPQSQQDEQS